MSYDVSVLNFHPGRNPAHNPNASSRKLYHGVGRQRILLGYLPRNPGRWLPHQGLRECARRRAQEARLIGKRLAQ